MSQEVTCSKSPMTTPDQNLNEAALVIKNFLRDMEFETPNIDPTNEQLEALLLAEYNARGFQNVSLRQAIHVSASYAELCYHDFALEEKKNIALFTLYMIHIDDMIARGPDYYPQFQQRFLRGEPQLEPVLGALAEVLLRMSDYYDPTCHNLIVLSVFEFFASSCVESQLDAQHLVRAAQRFPWFLRERTGVGAAYALFIFTKARKIKAVEYMQALPDMTFCVCVVNDILSYHKEELVGEKGNYIHTRAFVENKTSLQVLNEMADESHTSRNVIHRVLANSPDALRAWQDSERGYIEWHLIQDRYKLKDLGI